MRPKEVSISTCREAELASTAGFQSYIRDILNALKVFYPDEYAMIEYLAQGEVDQFLEMASYDATYVEHLVGYG